MANTLKIAATTTSGETPDDHGLQLGELAVNTTNKKVWVGTNGNNSGNVLLYDQATAYTNTTYSVGDGGLTQKNFTTTLKNKLDGIAASATNTAAPHYTSAIAVGDGGLTQKNFTTTLKNKLDGIAASATNTAAPHYTSAIAVGDGGLTQKNFTTTLKNKLDGIATGATNTAAPHYTSAIGTGDGKLTTKNFTTTLKNKLDGIEAGATADQDLSAYVTNTELSNELDALVDAAPGALDTLNELAASIGDDASYATTVTNALAGKLGSTAKAADSNLLDGLDSAAFMHRNNGTGYYQVNTWMDLGPSSTGLYWSTNTGAGWHIYPSGTSGMRIRSGNSGAGHLLLQCTSTLHGYLSWDSSNNVFIKNEDGDARLTVPSSGNLKRDTHNIWDAGNVVGGTGISIAGNTITCTVTDTNTQLTDTQVRSKFSGGTNVAIDSSGVISSTNTTYSVGDGGLTQKNFTTTLKNKLDGIAASATNTAAPYYTSAIGTGDGKLTTKNFTTTLKNKLDGIAASATNTPDWTASGAGTIHAHNYTNTTYAEGDHGLTQANFTDTLRNKLNGIAASATNTAAPHYTSAIAVGDGGLTQKNFTTTLKNKLDGIAASATNTAAPYYTSAIGTGDGKLTTKNFTTTLKNKLDGIAAGATNTAAPYYTSAIASTSLTNWAASSAGTIHSSNYTNTTYSEGDHGLTQANFTDTLRNKLNGIAASANNYSHPTGAGNNHIPSGGAANKFLKWSSSGVATWEYDNSGVFSLTAGWGLTGGTISSLGTISHSTANGFKHIPSDGSSGQFLGYSSEGTAAWVSNPNTDTNTWRSCSDSVTSTSSSISASQLAVKTAYDRSWPNTTYTASTGLYMSGGDIRHSDTSSQSSVNNSGQTFIQDISLDTYGHITAITSATASGGGGGTTTWNGLENMSALSSLP